MKCNNHVWSHIESIKTNHKELNAKFEHDYDLSILDKVKSLKLEGIIKRL